MRIAKLVSAAALLITTAVVGGTLIGSALATPGGASQESTTADPVGGVPLGGANGEYCDVYLDTFAAELGVSRDDLLPAGKAAAIAAIDAAVANGDLTQERADQLKARIEGIEEAGCGFLGGLGHAWGRGFGHGFGHGFTRGFVGADVLDAAATALGLDSADLITAMGDGSSLQDVATEQGVSYDDVKAAVLAALDADLEAAVAEGMPQEHADRIRAATEQWLDNGGEPLRGRWRGHFERPN